MKNFIERFNIECLKVLNLEDSQAYTAFLIGFKSSKFKVDLINDEVETYTEAMERARRFIYANKINN